MIEASGLSKRYGSRVILADLSLALEPGQFVAIVGESGAGKSTLLNLIAGLDVPDAGAVRIAGTDICALDEDGRTRLRRAKIGFVFQAFHILPHLTLAQNVMLPLVLLGVPADERRARVAALLDAVGLGDRIDALPSELSGGELQRVAIVRALVHRPALLLADEPTGNLDPDTAAAVLALLSRTLREHGAAGLLVTHSEAAARTADRVVRLSRGRLVAA
jgi:putative ABC transport system ATP-binding protein